MYQRKNASNPGILPSTSDYSYPGSGYRSTYGESSFSASSSNSRFGAKSKAKSSGSLSLPSWWRSGVIALLVLFLISSRFRIMKLQKEAEGNQWSNRRDRDFTNRPKDSQTLSSVQRELSNAQRQLSEKRAEFQKERRKTTQLEKEKQELISEVEQHKKQKKTGGDALSEENSEVFTEMLEKYKNREETLYSRIGLLQKKIQRESHREVLARFGPGPHHVLFTLKLPDILQSSNALSEDEYVTFKVQMAGVEQMPHSVSIFLEQVVKGLWNGCTFLVNAEHILQAGPHSMRGQAKLKDFQDAELDMLAFQEYNETFPHEKYTLGFAGRPAGPDFYINKIDNTLNHGPGGQEHHTLEEEAEPAFAKVIDGFQWIDLIGTLQTRGAQNLLRNPVDIVKVELLDNPEGGAVKVEVTNSV